MVLLGAEWRPRPPRYSESPRHQGGIVCGSRPWSPQLSSGALLKPPILLHGLDVLASIAIVKMNVRQPVKVNVSDKWHRPIATCGHCTSRRTLLCFGGIWHLPQCSALPGPRNAYKKRRVRVFPPLGELDYLFVQKAAWQRRLPTLGSRTSHTLSKPADILVIVSGSNA